MFEQQVYSSNTQGILIEVRPFFAQELSEPLFHKFVFIYKITIKNQTPYSIQLLKREWHIIEEDGIEKVIKGEGVVGQQPVINAGKEFEYASQAVLYSKSGIMHGKYELLIMDTASVIYASIPPFSLDVSYLVSLQGPN